MSTPGRPKGEYRSAQHEGTSVSTPGRPKGDYRSAQHEGTSVSTLPTVDHDTPLPFENRDEAGLLLAERLLHLRLARPMTVIALPRGGVPVAAVVARVLNVPLDLLLVRKIGMPRQPERTLAALADGHPPQLVTDDRIWLDTGDWTDDFESQARDALCEIARRRQVYLRGRDEPDLRGRTAIVVDDGIATGTTMRAALLALRRRRPAWLVLAVPVAARESMAMLRTHVDQVVCLAEPQPFEAVGRHYVDFDPVGDSDVVSALASWTAVDAPSA